MSGLPLTDGRKNGGFTLVEVILAILIMAAILSVVLYFYQYIADTRKRALDESEQVSTARLFMEQITTELRMARSSESPYFAFEGGPDFISFLTTSLPAMSQTQSGSTNRAGPVGNTLRILYYGLTVTTNEAGGGLERSEEPFAKSAQPAVSTNSPSAKIPEPKSAVVTFDDGDGKPAKTPVEANPLALTDEIRFLRFRYWDGSDWQDSWSSTELPLGVEVSIGKEPLPKESSLDEYPFELFRRTIYLPGSHPNNPADAPDESPAEAAQK